MFIFIDILSLHFRRNVMGKLINVTWQVVLDHLLLECRQVLIEIEMDSGGGSSLLL